MFSLSIYINSFADVGLDQNLSVSVNSYLYDYFQAMESFLNVGVPVYFVLEGPFPYHNEDARSLVCGSAGCDLFGLSEQISRASKQPQNSTIETPAASWIDDYIDWLEPTSRCCYENRRSQEFCPEPNILGEHILYIMNVELIMALMENSECSLCVSVFDDVTENDFMSQLDSWLSHNPNEDCSKGGHAAYGSAVYQEVFNDTTHQDGLEIEIT